MNRGTQSRVVRTGQAVLRWSSANDEMNKRLKLGSVEKGVNDRVWVICYPTRREHVPQPPAEQEAQYYAGSW